MTFSHHAHISFRDILHVIFKRKSQILLVFTSILIAVALVTLLKTPIYRATTQIQVKVGRENFYNPTLTPGGNFRININTDEQINSVIAIMKGHSLAERVLQGIGKEQIYPVDKVNKKNFYNEFFQSVSDFFYQKILGRIKSLIPSTAANESLNIEPVTTLENDQALSVLIKNLSINRIEDTNLITVSFKHENPKMAALVANTFSKYYLKRHLNIHKTPQSYRFLEEQTKILQQKLSESESNLTEFKKKTNITSPEEEKRILLERIADNQDFLNRTESEEVEAINHIKTLNIQLSKTPRLIPREEVSSYNQNLISALETKLVELQIKEHDLKSRYTDIIRFPEVDNVKKEIEMVKSKLSEEKSKRHGVTRSGVNDTYKHLQIELMKYEAELKAIQARKNVQLQQLDDFQAKLSQLNQMEAEYNRLSQKLEVDSKNYRLYLTKFEESRVSLAMDREQIASVNQVEPAYPPLKPVSPNVMLNILLGLFLGGVGSLTLAFALDFFDDSLQTVDQVEGYLELPVLVSIPDLKNT